MLHSRLPVYALSIREFVHAPHPQCVVNTAGVLVCQTCAISTPQLAGSDTYLYGVTLY